MKKLAIFALALPMAAQDLRPASPSADQIKFVEQIKLVQEHEAVVRRAQHREVEPTIKVELLVKDHRTVEQKEADRLLLEQYFRLKPTGKLVGVEFPDGVVLYVPEARAARMKTK